MLKKTNFAIILLKLTCFVLLLMGNKEASAQRVPGGVSTTNIELWIKANEEVFSDRAGNLAGTTLATDGDLVESWGDFSGTRTNALTDSDAKHLPPLFGDNPTDYINFNPTVVFDAHTNLGSGITNGLSFRDEYIYSPGTGTQNGMTWFSVVQPNITGSGANRRYVFDFGKGTDAGYGFAYTTNNYEVYTPSDGGGVRSEVTHARGNVPTLGRFKIDFGNTQELSLDGALTPNHTDPIPNLNELTRTRINEAASSGESHGPFAVGRQAKNTGISRAFSGGIAELIGFSRVLDPGEINKIESYLALKYGISLDQTTAQDYMASDGMTKMWDKDVANADTYNNGIFGIGRDDASTLDQKQTKSVNTDALVTIGLGTIAASNDANPNTITNNLFMTVANNNGAIGFQTSEIDATKNISERLTREWMVQEPNGDVGAVDVMFDLSDPIFMGKVIDQFVLLVNSDGIFSNGATNITPTSLTGTPGTAGATMLFDDVTQLDDQTFFTLVTDIASPGSVVENMALWIKANEAVYSDKASNLVGTTPATNSNPVESWGDRSNARTNDLTDSDPNHLAPVFGDNPTDYINFNPTVIYDGLSRNTHQGNGLGLGEDYIYSSGAGTEDGMTWFSVVQPVSTGSQRYVFDFGESTTDGYGLAYSASAYTAYTPTDGGGERFDGTHTRGNVPTLARFKIDFGVDQEINYDGALTPTRTDGITGLLALGNSQINQSSSSGNSQGPFTVGRQSKRLNNTTRVFSGGIAEIIGYTKALSQVEINQVESYLALKYGITLDQGTAQDYMASDGTTKIWDKDATNAATYNNDIFGIGQDDKSALDQKQTKSVNTDALVTVGLGAIATSNEANTNSFTADFSFMTLANNDLDIAAYDLTGAPSGFSKLARQWQVQETGTVGAVTISVPDNSSTLNTKLPTGNQVFLLQSTDTNFSDETPVLMTLSGTNWEHNVDLSNGAYISFATNVISVEFTESALSDLEADGSNLPSLTISGGVLASEATIEVAIDAASTATAADDYTFNSPLTVTIPAGNYTTEQTIVIPGLSILNDVISELNENIIFNLQNPSAFAAIADADGDGTTENSTTYTILDEDPSVTNSGSLLSGVDLNRVADGMEVATITLQLRKENGDDLSTAGVEVQFATSLGTLSNTGLVITDANGQAFVTLSSTTIGGADVTAEIDTDNDNMVDAPVNNGSPVQVVFTAPIINSTDYFLITYDTEIAGSSNTGSGMLTIPVVGGLYDVDIGNDGTFELTDQSGLLTIDVTMYTDLMGVSYAPGTIQVAIANAASGGGNFEHIQFNNTNDATKVMSIDQWGRTIIWTSMLNAFLGGSNLDVLATDLPNLSAVTNLVNMFSGCRSLLGTPVFNSWDVSNVNLFINMFANTDSFNQDIGMWDVSNGNRFTGMFLNATIFNQDIGAWDVSLGTHFDEMFRNTLFDQDIGSWDVSSGTIFSNMFFGAAFNQDIGSWDVSRGTVFSNMFTNTTAFNQDIGGWDMSRATNFLGMFTNATAFNQDISGWNVSNVTNFFAIFDDATSFNQDLGSWDVGAMTLGINMFDNSAMSLTNWDATLIGWEAQNFTNSNVIVGAENLTFCAADAERTAMETANIFSFVGDVACTADPTNGNTTLVANPTSVVADGMTTSTITLTLADANGNLLSFSGGTAVFTNTGSATLSGITDNMNGTYTATITNTVTEQVEVSATLDGNSVTDKATVDFTPGAADPTNGNTTLVANPTSVVADGTTTSTITLTLADANGNLVGASGGTVVFTNTGSATLSAVSDNGDGTYTATITSTVAEQVEVSATLDGNSVTDKATVDFTPGAADPTNGNTTLVANPTSVVADGTTTSTITLTLADANGNPLTGSGGTAVFTNTGSATLSAVSDNGDGTYTATITNTVAEQVEVSATLDGNSVTDKATVDFTPGAADPTNGNTTLVANPTSVVADGTTTSTITLTLADANGNLVGASGGTVVFTNTGSATLSAVSDNGDGTYTATITNTVAEQVEVSATLDGNSVTDKATVDFTPGAADPTNGNTTLVANPTSVVADGTTTSTITLTLADANGNPLTGSGGTAVFTNTGSATLSGITDNMDGTYTATITNTVTEQVEVSATLDGNSVTDKATVDFTPGAADPTNGNTTLVANPTSVVADGTTTSTITLTLADANGNLVGASGGTVVFTNTGSATLSAVSDNGDGTYTATITSTVAEQVEVSATLDGNSVTDKATVDFTPGAADPTNGNTTLVANPTSVVADGTTTSTITLTLADANGNLVGASGGTVVFTNTGSATLSGITDNMDGTYTATITNTVTEQVEVSATLDGNSVTDKATVDFTPGAADPTNGNTTLVANPTSVVADGMTTSTITLTLADANGNPLTGSGGTVVFTNTGSATLSGITDNMDGTYTATITSTVAEQVEVSATLDGNSVTDKATVDFTPDPTADTDGDGILNFDDVDIDGDGTVDNGQDTDGDGITDSSETANGTDPNNIDSDNDGIPDGADVDSGANSNIDTDGDGVQDGGDVDDTTATNTTDSDGDGIIDLVDPLDNGLDTDTDGDGIPDVADVDPTGTGTPLNGEDSDGDGINDVYDLDTDGDGIPNYADADADGDGVIDTGSTDTDGDGITDIIEGITGTDPNNVDSDNDGIPDGADVDSGANSNVDTDGDGVQDGGDVDDTTATNTTDSDGDGIIDLVDPYDNTDPTDTDGDGIPDVADVDPTGTGIPLNGEDSDGDGILDDADSDDSPMDGTTDTGNTDTDGDGIDDRYDPVDTGDDDGDGIPNYADADADGDGVIDTGSTDTDGDGITDIIEGITGTDPNNVDSDNDGIPDGADVDSGANSNIDTDGDGVQDGGDVDDTTATNTTDSDGDGIIDLVDPYDNTDPTDTDGDGIPDVADVDPTGTGTPLNGEDSDGDGILDDADSDDSPMDGTTDTGNTDTDGDGIDDRYDPVDTGDDDGDGIPNYADADADGDGVIDTGSTDTDGDGITDIIEGITGTDPNNVDSDNDGIPDGADVDSGANSNIDTDGDGVQDGGDVDDTTATNTTDSDGDGIIDLVDPYDNTDPTDTDGDGIPDVADVDPTGTGIPLNGEDSDGDGILDDADSDDSPMDGTTDTGNTDTDGDGIDDRYDPVDTGDDDGDGIPNYADADADGDGVIDTGSTDTDGDGITDIIEGITGTDPNNVDSDNDGIPDGADVDSGANSNVDTDGDGVQDGGDVDDTTATNTTDSDGDGIIDLVDPYDNTDPTDTDGDGIPDVADVDPTGTGIPLNGEDSDGDGILDDADSDDSPMDGTTDTGNTDTDGDGIDDRYDPVDTGDDDGDGIPNYADADADGDGVIDTGSTDTDGDGITDIIEGITGTDPNNVDSDNDGIPDGADVDSGANSNIDTDGDGVQDGGDVDDTTATNTTDSDGDGIIDLVDPYDNTDPTDTDGDGIPDVADVDPTGTGTPLNGEDSDGDGILDDADSDDSPMDGTTDTGNTDTDGDGIDDRYDPVDTGDDDGDGIPNYADADADGDGVIDTGSTDTDGDGITDIIEGITGTDPNNVDSDNDGIPDGADVDSGANSNIDTDGDGVQDGGDVDDTTATNTTDSDGNGIIDLVDPLDNGLDTDTDGDGIPDVADVDPTGTGTPLNGEDSDGDGINDVYDLDTDGDGIPNYADADADGDGLIDTGSTDTDGDGITDIIEGITGTDPNNVDSDNDGIPDGADVDSGANSNVDTDGDGVQDGGDVDDTTATNTTDSDGDGIIDLVDPYDNTDPTDTDGDGIPDVADVDPTGTGIPLNGEDSDGDGILDDADSDDSPMDGTTDTGNTDTDGDGIDDRYDPVDTGDDDGDGIPNYADADADGDGVIDTGSTDTDGDGITDIIEGITGTDPNNVDSDNDGIPDGADVDSGANSNIDTDGDGVQDGGDVDDTTATNTTDSDGDGIIDLVDPYDNTDPTDTDGDGIPDVADVDPTGTGIPLNGEDSDGDGILDDADSDDSPSDGITDTGNTDTDGDGIDNRYDPVFVTDDSLEIFNVMTPNGDGKNDVFTIRNIELYPDNTLKIYDRSGILIYQVDGYGQNGNYFKGFSDGRSTIRREETLPVGTYFYTLRYNNNTNTVNRSGYLYINR